MATWTRGRLRALTSGPNGSKVSKGDSCLYGNRLPQCRVGASPSFLPQRVKCLCLSSLHSQCLGHIGTSFIPSFIQQVTTEHPPCAGHWEGQESDDSNDGDDGKEEEEGGDEADEDDDDSSDVMTRMTVTTALLCVRPCSKGCKPVASQKAQQPLGCREGCETEVLSDKPTVSSVHAVTSPGPHMPSPPPGPWL